MIFLYRWFFNKNISQTNNSKIAKEEGPENGLDISDSHEEIIKTVFIPYWNLPQNLQETEEYKELYYFGIKPNSSGGIEEDEGFANLSRFMSVTNVNSKKYLTVRMLDEDINKEILENPKAQDELIENILEIVSQNEMDGVVLDLEMGISIFNSEKGDINNFVEKYADSLHSKGKKLFITAYGDNYYRKRPYDMSFISDVADGVVVMAYDFHKSSGEPGANFPFASEGYNFKKMVRDFLRDVPAEKLTIAFGMYGYDWSLGKQGLPLNRATAIALYQIEQKTIPGCKNGRLKSCKIFTDEDSKEKNISYIDDEGNEHVIYFEDRESVDIKIDYLKEQGISKVGYWVWGYFDNY